MPGDLSIYTRGARFERLLRTLQPGQAVDITAQELSDIVVPANPLDRQTPEYLVEWFKIRMPFYCEVSEGIGRIGRKWTFYRPKIDP